jgi:hypothetical protein
MPVETVTFPVPIVGAATTRASPPGLGGLFSALPLSSAVAEKVSSLGGGKGEHHEGVSSLSMSSFVVVCLLLRSQVSLPNFNYEPFIAGCKQGAETRAIGDYFGSTVVVRGWSGSWGRSTELLRTRGVKRRRGGGGVRAEPFSNSPRNQEWVSPWSRFRRLFVRLVVDDDGMEATCHRASSSTGAKN